MGIQKLERHTPVLGLPKKVMTFHGFEIDPNQDMWRIPDSSRRFFFNFEALRNYCSAEIIISFKQAIIWYLVNWSVGYANRHFREFYDFVKEIFDKDKPCFQIHSYHILSYKGNIDEEREWHLATLSCFLRQWHNLGYSGVGKDSYDLLNFLTLKANPRKGWAVLTMDPIEGPFTEMELRAIHHEVNSNFNEGNIGIRLYGLIWLFMALGIRPVQIADVKVGDVRSIAGQYSIDIPRAKQRMSKRRAAYKERPLIREIGEVLDAWIIQVIKDGERFAPGVDSKNLPLFPNWEQKGAFGMFEYHSDGESLSKEIRKFFSMIEVYSHRTKNPIRVTPQRFRYTLGTRAAMEKQGPLVIAELLDHSDIQNVVVYTKATPEIIKILDEALGCVLGRLSKAFKGEIILDSFDTGRPVDPAKLVRLPRLDPRKGGVGYCGTCVGCTANLPYMCYVCPQFKAWLDGPHDDVLKDLLEERRTLLEITNDETMAFANDHLILAVAQVVDMCKEIKASRNEA